MKKYLLSVIAAALAFVSADAQNRIVNNPDNKPYFGIRVGGEVTCPGDITIEHFGISAFKNGGGVEFGGIYNIPVVANFYVEPGLKLYYNTYSVKDDIIKAFGDEMEIGLDGISIRKFGMRIPVMAGYHFDFTDDVKLSVFTGPELEIGFSAKEHVSGDDLSGWDEGYSFESSENLYSDGGYNRVDLLWGFGAGITYSKFYFGVSGNVGMLNIANEPGVKFHENRVTFSVGYNF